MNKRINDMVNDINYNINELKALKKGEPAICGNIGWDGDTSKELVVNALQVEIEALTNDLIYEVENLKKINTKLVFGNVE